MNGSVTPKVISFLWSPGSGPPAISSSRWFCQKQSARATPKTTRQTTMPGAQLVEVLDEGEPVLVGDRPDAAGHRRASAAVVGDRSRRSARPARRAAAAADSSSAASSGSSSSSSSCSPVTEPLNSRMPRPRLLPSSGRRLGPKTTRAMIRTIASSSGPMLGIGPMVTAAGAPIGSPLEIGRSLPGSGVFSDFVEKVRIESPFRGFDR